MALQGSGKAIEPIVLIPVTAFDDKETRDRCFDIGCNYFFTKPVNTGQLRRILNAVFGSDNNDLLRKSYSEI